MSFDLFDGIGLFVVAYVVRAVITGEVFAKSGPGGRTVSRSEEPRSFWIAIAVYAALSVALLTVF